MQSRDFHDRVNQAMRIRRKRWYRHWYNWILLILAIVIAAAIGLYIFLVNFYYQKIISGELVSTAVSTIQQEARIDLLQRQNDPSIGLSTAPATIVIFEDFECPYSRDAQPFIKKLTTTHSDVRIVFKNFPLPTIHPNAQAAAEAAECAFEQDKFWEFHDELFANQDRLAEAFFRATAKKIGLNVAQFNGCYSSGKFRRRVSEDVELGQTLGVEGTPTFFVNGEFFAKGWGKDVAMQEAFEKAVDYIKSL